MKKEFEHLSLSAMEELVREVLARGRRFRFAAHGGSMSPFIRDGDLVELSPISEIAVGDVVAVTDGKRFLVHRVVQKKEERFLLKGDHAREPDGWFDRLAVLGTVTKVFHQGKERSLGITHFCKTVAILSKRNELSRLLRIYAVIRRRKSKKNT